MDSVNYDDFNKICRICLSLSKHKISQDVVISRMYYMLIGIPFETNNQLPQQICIECFKKIIELNAFVLKCKHSHSILIKCLENIKNIEVTNKYSGQEITIEEHKLEFVKVEENVIDDQNINSVQFNINVKIEDTNSESTSITNEVSNVPKRKYDVKPSFKCDICNKSFKKLNHFNVHKRIHSGERPYACEICNKSFNQSNDLNKHKRIHRDERPYVCEVCNKSFKFSNILNKHKRIHSGEHHCSCKICNKSFIQLSDLKVHERVHSGELPYSCEICNKSFNQSGNLKRHKRTHNNQQTIK